MNLHLVFDSTILKPLSESLTAKKYNVTGTDVTLDQFLIAAEAGQIDAEVAIVDGVLGIIHKRDNIRILKGIRMRLPNIRLVVLLPEWDIEWVKDLGKIGIYDVHTTEQFGVDDVISWIENKKTLADVPEMSDRSRDHKPAKVPESSKKLNNKGQKINLKSIIAPIFSRLKSKEVEQDKEEASTVVDPNKESEVCVKEQSTNEVVEQAVSVDQVGQKSVSRMAMSSPHIIAVGGMRQRSGCTHTAIQIAYESVQKGLRTAFIEFRKEDNESDIISFCNELNGVMARKNGIDFFPNRSPMDIVEIYSLEYEVIVLDLGVLVDEQQDKLVLNMAGQEFLRSHTQYLTLSSAPWDLNYMARYMKDIHTLLRKSSIILNYADDGMLEEIQELLPSIQVIQNQLVADPFTDTGVVSWIDQKPKQKKKWFIY